MNGDFGASADSDGHSQASSPTARMYAPSKQPLKSESGKHWTKPNRGALGNSSSESGSTDDPPVQEPALSPGSVTSSGSRPAQVRAVSSVISPAKPPVEAANNNSLKGGDRPSTLDKQISYKYIPLELASATTVKNSIAKNILYQSLGHGLMVIKYGRQGGPKQRILYCDFNVTRLYWTNSVVDADAAHASGIESQFDPSKMVSLAEVVEVRAGTDLDPETSMTALTAASKNGHQAAMILKQKKEASTKAGAEDKVHEKRKSLVGSLFGSHAHDKEDELLYGTATLRKKAKPEEFSRCLSLITQDRSVDIQCFSKKDYNLLYINLKEIVNKLRNPTTVPATLAPAVSEYRETLSTKKSVRFASPEDAEEGKEDQPPASSNSNKPNRLTAVNSFASTMTDSSQPDVVYELNDDNSIDKLLSSPGIAGGAAAKAPSSAASGMRRRAGSDGSDSGHNPHTFSDEQHRADREMVRTLSGISGLSLDIAPAHGRSYSNDEKESNSAKSPYRMKAHEALQIGLILSQQEQQFGTNMYQALRPEDEPEIEHLNSMGYSTEEAILKIFQKRYQPDLHEDGDNPAPVSLESNSARFEYDDQFNESGDTFSGSVKSMFGRQSSFFPQVFHDGSETEVSITEKTAGGGRKDRAPPSATPEDSDDSVKVSPKASKAGKAESKSAAKQMFSSPMTQRQKDMMQPEADSSPSKKQNPILRLSSNDALQIGLLLSQQEEEHGVNMYDSLEVSDEATIRRLCQQGYSNDEAVLEIFNRKFGKTGPQTKWSGVSAAQPVSSRLPSPPAQQSSFSPPPLPSGYLGQRNVSEMSPPPPAYQQSSTASFASGGSQRNSFTPELSPPPPYQTPSQPQPLAYQTPPQPTPPAYQTPPPPQQLPGAYPSGGTQRSSAYSESSAQSAQSVQSSYGSSAYQQQNDFNSPYRPPPINTQPPPRQALQRSNSLAQSSFFPNDPNVMRPQYAQNPNGNGPQQQQQQHQLNRQNSMLSPRTVSRSNMLTTLTDDEAVNMALMLSQQETDHGINMYDSLRASDEQELQNLIASGYTNEQAVLFIFEKRYPPKNQHRPQPFANQQNPAVTRQSMYNMPVPQQPPAWEDPNMGYQMHTSSYPVQQQPGYGPPPQRSMARPQSMYAPPPEVRPSVLQQQHQLQSMYSSQYGGMSEPSPVPLGGHDPRMMRPPAAPTPPVVHQPLQRQQSILIPVREQPSATPPVVSVVSAVPISDADDRMAAPQATHVGYMQGNAGYPQGNSPQYVQTNVASAVPAAQWSPPPAYSRPAPGPSPQNYQQQQSYQGNNNNNYASHNSSNGSMGSGGNNNNNNNNSGGQGDRKLVKKRSIFNFVTSGNGGEHTGGAGRQRYKDADVHAITKMGYTKDQAVWALLQSNNNLPMAIEALCNS